MNFCKHLTSQATLGLNICKLIAPHNSLILQYTSFQGRTKNWYHRKTSIPAPHYEIIDHSNQLLCWQTIAWIYFTKIKQKSYPSLVQYLAQWHCSVAETGTESTAAAGADVELTAAADVDDVAVKLPADAVAAAAGL